MLLVLALGLCLFAVKLTGPSNLMDNDQERPAAYVLDAVLHGHWFCQSDFWGDIMSKPPLFTWIAAAATLPFERINLFSLYLPCLIAVLGTATILFLAGRRWFGWTAGLLAALMYLISPAGVKHIALARTDGLFAATITAAALLAYLAWTRRISWVWFWLAAALTTLTKGPLGVLLAAMGLLATVWERLSGKGIRSSSSLSPEIGGQRVSQKRGPGWISQLVGVLLFLLLTGSWFWLAYLQAGQPFIDKVIGRELLGHVVGDKHGTFGIGFVKAPLYFLSRFLPWSLLAVVGLWRIWKNPSEDGDERRFERFLFCWILGGLFVFCLATHQRGDLPLPLYPAAALLAGRELARILAKWEAVRVWRNAAALSAVVLAAYTVYLHTVFARTEVVQQSEGMEVLACQIRRQLGDNAHILHVDSPFALQFHLNTMERTVSFEEAAGRLTRRPDTIAAVHDLSRLRELLHEDPAGMHVLARWPDSDAPFLLVLSNQPDPRRRP